MAEYIDRQELLENLNKFAPEHYSVLVNTIITKQPAADVVEVKHGEWIERDSDYDTYYDCSVCGESFYFIEGSPTDNAYAYCPNCGAKMDGGKENEQT